MHLALKHYHITLAAVSRHQLSVSDGSIESQSGVCEMFHGVEMEHGFEAMEQQPPPPELKIVSIEVAQTERRLRDRRIAAMMKTPSYHERDHVAENHYC